MKDRHGERVAGTVKRDLPHYGEKYHRHHINQQKNPVITLCFLYRMHYKISVFGANVKK
jgi:hypothetical protein